MRIGRTCLAGMLALTSLLALAQGSAPEVRLWAASCAACHGTDGKAEGTGLYLAGRPADELYQRLIAYKTGKLPATVMHQHAKGYTDEELRRLADHFSRIQ